MNSFLSATIVMVRLILTVCSISGVACTAGLTYSPRKVSAIYVPHCWWLGDLGIKQHPCVCVCMCLCTRACVCHSILAVTTLYHLHIIPLLHNCTETLPAPIFQMSLTKTMLWPLWPPPTRSRSTWLIETWSSQITIIAMGNICSGN